ncbi:hypothetical protein VCRA2123E76_100093 [Vibrio crassostreae]|nr:hypothetical protein VCRA2123E76_100093 [Vibrio crassostreae]
MELKYPLRVNICSCGNNDYKDDLSSLTSYQVGSGLGSKIKEKKPKIHNPLFENKIIKPLHKQIQNIE